MRELQGDEGLTCIIKEGVRYQLQSLEVGPKREPRAKPSTTLWREITKLSDYKCVYCGLQEPNIKLSPDHRRPRSRGGNNDDSNWQPLCEQCNNHKSASCQGCNLNCMTCHWAYPENHKTIIIDDNNRELIRRYSATNQQNQSDYVNKILTDYFNKIKK